MKGDYENALLYYNEAINLTPDDVTVNNDRGVTLLQLNRTEEAIESFQKAYSLSPENAVTLYNLGRGYLSLNIPDKAYAYFNQSSSLNQSFKKGLFYQGIIQYDAGSYTEALQLFERYSEYYPDDVASYFNQGQCYEKLEIMDKAAKMYDKALSMDPDYA
ncbi:MAG: tetratricopeptide repeat protein, partial [Methanospirillum sp.]|nr:tetratricopeptide repeat protein [Methanospirillum sp.]